MSRVRLRTQGSSFNSPITEQRGRYYLVTAFAVLKEGVESVDLNEGGDYEWRKGYAAQQMQRASMYLIQLLGGNVTLCFPTEPKSKLVQTIVEFEKDNIQYWLTIRVQKEENQIHLTSLPALGENDITIGSYPLHWLLSSDVLVKAMSEGISSYSKFASSQQA